MVTTRNNPRGTAGQGTIHQKDMHSDGKHRMWNVFRPTLVGTQWNMWPGINVPCATAVTMFGLGRISPTRIGDDVGVFPK